jgi:hypothetical protein
MRSLLLATLLAVPLMALAGCGSSLPESPDYEVANETKNDEVVGEDDDGESEGAGVRGEDAEPEAPTKPSAGGPAAPAAPAGPPLAGVYSGKLATTSRVKFTDETTCNYEVWMKTVSVAVTIKDGKVTVAKVSGQMNDTYLEPECGEGNIMEPNVHAFALTKPVDVAPLEAGKPLRVAMTGTTEMAPTTELDLQLLKTADGIEATVTWNRVDDVEEALKWKLTTKVVVKPAP